MKPRFHHDCKKCIFLGQLNGADAYCCPSDRGNSYILRTGNEDMYASSKDFQQRFYDRHVKEVGYFGTDWEPGEIEMDRLRSILVKVLRGTIASLMVNPVK